MMMVVMVVLAVVASGLKTYGGCLAYSAGVPQIGHGRPGRTHCSLPRVAQVEHLTPGVCTMLSAGGGAMHERCGWTYRFVDTGAAVVSMRLLHPAHGGWAGRALRENARQRHW